MAQKSRVVRRGRRGHAVCMNGRNRLSMTMSGGKQFQPPARTPLEEQLDLVVTQSAPRKGKAFLMVSTGPAAGTVFPVTQASLLVGRSLSADVSINEQAISNEHARLEQNDAGFALRDL